jgi:alanyl-tRNA synthetase
LAKTAIDLKNGPRYVVHKLEASPEELRGCAIKLSQEIVGVAILFSEYDAKAAIVVAVDKQFLDHYAADRILRQLLPYVEGRGGGMKHLAQGGGLKLTGIRDAMESIPEALIDSFR